jgi:hypothetical protein
MSIQSISRNKQLTSDLKPLNTKKHDLARKSMSLLGTRLNWVMESQLPLNN